MKLLENLIRFAVIPGEPKKVVKLILRHFDNADFKLKLDYDGFKRTEYAYCTYYAALEAKALGISSISLLEFGVAGGAGLIELEKIARKVSAITGIGIEIYGFDLESGLPEASDYSDLPYVWEKGFFKMDIAKLKSKLTSAKLVIGNVEETARTFIEKFKPSPIGFISFDLDYYTSTVSAFKIFYSSSEYFLPRVYCYFDDIIGDDWELHSEFTGELLAINEFNQQNEKKKLARINGLKYKRKIDAYWNDSTFILHWFEHPLYNKNINPKKNWQLKLE